MSGRVDKPSGVEGEAVAEDDSDKVGVPEGFTPEVPWDHCWEDEAADDDGWDVILLLVVYYWVVEHVGHVYSSSNVSDICDMENYQSINFGVDWNYAYKHV